MAMIGGDSGFSGARKVNRPHVVGRPWRSIGSSLASILTRDCAWRALLALARKRSTKACRCLRCASCFLAVGVEHHAVRALALERRYSRRDRA